MGRKINSLSDESLQKIKRELQKSQNTYSNLSRRLTSQRGHEAVWMPGKVVKIYNSGDTTLQQYQPAVYYAPCDSSGNTITDPDNFKPNKIILNGEGFDSSTFSESSFYYLWNLWGVAQEQIAPGAIGKFCVDGFTPIRIKLTVPHGDVDIDESIYVMPYYGENYARPARGGAARWFYTTSDTDSQGVSINICQLGRQSTRFDKTNHHSNVTVTAGDSTMAKNYANTASASDSYNLCFTKQVRWTAGTDWSGTTLNDNVDGIEAIDKCYVRAEMNGIITPNYTGTVSGSGELEIGFDIVDNLDAYSGGNSINVKSTPITTITVVAVDYPIAMPNAVGFTVQTEAFLERGYKIYPRIQKTTEANVGYVISGLRAKYTDLLDEVY